MRQASVLSIAQAVGLHRHVVLQHHRKMTRRDINIETVLCALGSFEMSE